MSSGCGNENVKLRVFFYWEKRFNSVDFWGFEFVFLMGKRS